MEAYSPLWDGQQRMRQHQSLHLGLVGRQLTVSLALASRASEHTIQHRALFSLELCSLRAPMG